MSSGTSTSSGASAAAKPEDGSSSRQDELSRRSSPACPSRMSTICSSSLRMCASSGGWTSAGSAPYLLAQEDPYDGWDGNGVHDWTRTVGDAVLERHFPAIGDLTSIEIAARDGNGEWGGRVTDMAFIGTTGTARVDGDTVRSYFGLNSDWFTFAVTPRQKGPARQ